MVGDETALVLAALAAVIAFGRVGAACAQRLRQPAVVGEVVVGLLVGPLVAGYATASPMFAGSALPALHVLADMGLILFIFLIGLETDLTTLRRSSGRILAVSAGSFTVPFVAGTAIGFAYEGGDAVVPALFLGLAFAVTAFPVLARIVDTNRLTTHPDGRIALASAALIDAVIWILLVVLLAVQAVSSGWLTLLVVPYMAALFLVVRPLLERFLSGRPIDGSSLSVIGIGLLLSAAMTQQIGLHYVIGAVLFALVVTRSATRSQREAIAGRVGPLTEALLLPAFFVLAGSKVVLSDMSTGSLLVLLMFLGGAVLSKVLGTFLGARVGRLGTRSGMRIAVLMNARGLTELIVLDVGRQIGILSEEVFAVMMIVAIMTTIMTAPCLALVDRRNDRHMPPGSSRAAGDVTAADDVPRPDAPHHGVPTTPEK